MDTTKFSRRSAVALLGIAAVGTGAESVEALGATSDDKLKGYKFGGQSATPTMVANALERLAADIRAGGSLVMESELRTKMNPEDFITHQFSVTFAVKDSPQS